MTNRHTKRLQEGAGLFDALALFLSVLEDPVSTHSAAITMDGKDINGRIMTSFREEDFQKCAAISDIVSELYCNITNTDLKNTPHIAAITDEEGGKLLFIPETLYQGLCGVKNAMKAEVDSKKSEILDGWDMYDGRIAELKGYYDRGSSTEKEAGDIIYWLDRISVYHNGRHIPDINNLGGIRLIKKPDGDRLFILAPPALLEPLLQHENVRIGSMREMH